MKATKRLLPALAALCMPAFAETTITPGPWDLYYNSTLQQSGFGSEGACADAATARNVTRTYTCRTRTTIAVTQVTTPPPPPPPPPPPNGSVSYSTTFDLAEYPISEGGRWHKTPNPWTFVRTTGGTAFGTNGVTNGYDDSYALLSGFGPNQTVEVVVQRNPGSPQTSHEALIMLRATDDTNNIRGYECLFNYYGGYDLVRWNGPFASWKSLSLTKSGWHGRELVTGDRLKCKMIGNTITSYINDVLMAEAVDSTFPTGQPGIGFFIRAGGTNNLLSITSLKASSE